MTQQEFTALAVLALATSFTPGPNTTLSAALGANGGWALAWRFVLAVPVGWSLLLGLSTAGLSSVVLAWPPLRMAISVTGAAYLFWLAAQLARSSQWRTVDASRLHVGFVQGVLLQFLNIKAWMLALTLSSGWIVGQADAATRALWMFPTLALLGLASNALYASVGATLRPWLSAHSRLLRFNQCMAFTLVLTALWMLWNTWSAA